MSADNYYVIKKHPSGGFAAVMGFASDDSMPRATKRHQQFATVEEALTFAWDDWTEYGVSVDAECRAALTAGSPTEPPTPPKET